MTWGLQQLVQVLLLETNYELFLLGEGLIEILLDQRNFSVLPFGTVLVTVKHSLRLNFK